jgi:hypothetical protein
VIAIMERIDETSSLTYRIQTEASSYLVDTERKLITREHCGQNPREHDGEARTYVHLEVDLGCPVVVNYASFGWVISTVVESIEVAA